MTQTPPQQPGPPAKLWDALPQIIDKLRNEFLLVTLGILILVVAIGVFASGVVESLGRAFFYLIVVLAWLAYLIGRMLDTWIKFRTPSEAPAPAAQSPGSPEHQPGQAVAPTETSTQPEPPAPAFDPPDQTVHGPQTNIGQSEGPVLSGTFHGPVTVGAPPTSPPSSAPTTAPPADPDELARLHQVLSARFDREDLRTLCFALGVEYDDLPAEGRDAKARELVRYMSRRDGGLARLQAAIEAARPGALDV